MIMNIDELRGEDYLNAADVDARISDLEDADRSQYEDDDSYEAAQGEQEALSAFRFAVSGRVGWGRWQLGFKMINDSYWDDFAVSEASDLFGSAVENSAWHDDEFACQLKQDYQQDKLDGTTFWFRA